MKNVNNYFLAILAVCLFSGVFLFMSIEALQNIYMRTGPGMADEWNIVRVSYMINGLLYLFVIITFLRFRRQLSDSH